MSTLLVAGCQSAAGRVDTQTQGNIRVLSLHGSRNFGGFVHYSGKIHAVDTSGREDIAKSFEDGMADRGFNIGADHPAMIFEIREVYAGPASGYKPVNADNGISAGTIAGAIGAGTACWLLHACGNALVATNTGMSVGNDAAKDLGYRRNADKAQANVKASLLVVNEVCQPESCAMSYASADDPSVTLEQLRLANAKQGMPDALINK
jgi:hypothetical protein